MRRLLLDVERYHGYPATALERRVVAGCLSGKIVAPSDRQEQH